MNKKPMWLCLLLVVFVPPTDALGGTPPSSVCQTSFNHDTNFHYESAGSVDSDYDSSGYIYVAISKLRKSNQTQLYEIAKISPTTCGVLWQKSPTKCNGSTCVIGSVHVDRAGRTALIYRVGSPAGTYIEVLNSLTGALINRSSNLQSLSPSWTDPRSLTSVRNGTTDLDYIAGDHGADRIARFNRNLTMRKWTVGLTNPTNLNCCSLNDAELFLYSGRAVTGSSSSFTKSNVTSGSQSADSTWAGRISAVDDEPPSVGYASTTTLFGHRACGDGGSTTLCYATVNANTWVVSGTTLFSPSQIQDGASLRDTNPQEYELDGSDNILSCGNYNFGSEPRGYFAHLKTSNNTMFWNVTIDSGGSTTIGGCHVDYGGGIWIVTYANDGGGSNNNNQFVTRYEGGGFTPTQQRLGQVTFPPTPTTPPFEGNFVLRAKGFMDNAWGFDWSWLLTIGIVAVFVAAFRRLGKDPLLTSTAIFLGIGTAVFLTLAPEWLLLIAILIIIMAAGNRIFNRGEDEGE